MTLNVTMQEYGVIRNALIKRPFEEIAGLIVNLDSQIVEQQKAEKNQNEEK